MMKKIISLVLLTILALSFVACSQSGVAIPEGMQIVSNGDVAYNFFVPGGWIPFEKEGFFGAYYSTSDRSSITASSLYPNGEMQSINDYWASLDASYKETFKNYTLIEAPENDQSNILLGDRKAYKYVFTADIDGVSYKLMQVVTVHDNMFYNITYTSTAELYESHLADVERSVAEFVFK